MTGPQDCPTCGLISPPEAQRCDCGWDFEFQRQEKSYLQTEISGPAPAGFWIRVLATCVDAILLLPLTALGFFSIIYLKSLTLMMVSGSIGLMYKPFMESRFGGTLGKMFCRVQVTNRQGGRLSFVAACIRSSPNFAQALVSVYALMLLFSLPQFQTTSQFVQIGELMQLPTFDWFYAVYNVVNLLVLADCLTVAFTVQKRAFHDWMAGSYCTWK